MAEPRRRQRVQAAEEAVVGEAIPTFATAYSRTQVYTSTGRL